MLTKSLQISLLIGILIAVTSGEIERRNITQWLDHFDYNCTETWENIYYIDDSLYQPGGPIFLYMGGMDFYTTVGYLNSSHFRDIAEEVGALLVGTEHRYYGESRPTPDLTKENLVYLTSAQALADAAELVRYLKVSSPDLRDAKVIASGISHSGTLASWMRLKYPDLIDGAWASSAPVQAVVNFHEFLPNAAETIKIYGGLICHHRMVNAFVMLEELFTEGNYTKIFEVFRMCHTEQEFDPELGGGLFFGTVASGIGMYISMLHSTGITSFCGYLDRGENEMYGLADWVYTAVYQNTGCLQGNVDEYLYMYMDPDWESIGALIGGRQQVWQSCNELGWFRSSDGEDHPFGNRFPNQLMYLQCEMILNGTITEEDIHQNINNTNAQFGGLSPNLTRVYYTNGALDADRSLSILEDLNEETPADIIPFFGQGADFIPMSQNTYSGLRAVQERVRSLILQWLEIDDGTTGTTIDTTTEANSTTTDSSETSPTTTPFPEATPYY